MTHMHSEINVLPVLNDIVHVHFPVVQLINQNIVFNSTAVPLELPIIAHASVEVIDEVSLSLLVICETGWTFTDQAQIRLVHYNRTHGYWFTEGVECVSK